MKARILVLILLLASLHFNAQKISTVFIDSIDITVNNKKIFTSTTTTLKFIPNTKDVKLTIFNDGIHKLIVSFTLKDKNAPYSLILSNPTFFINDTVRSLTHVDHSNYDPCFETLIGNCILQNWRGPTSEPLLKTRIKLCYSLTYLSPIDTSNYKYNYREGEWIGRGEGTEKVTVNFKNDKKNGLSTALYSDGLSYNVYFKDNVPDNYGQGYWVKNNVTQHGFKFKYFIPGILGPCDFTNDNSFCSFDFCRKSKVKNVNRYHDLSVHYSKKGIKTDSLEYHVRGDFMTIAEDSMVIESEEVSVHDFYKTYTDSLHFFSKIVSGGFVKVPLKDISKIYYERSEWKTFTLRTTLVSFASAFIISPLLSIQKNGFNYDRFSKITFSSLGVAVVSVTFGIAFSQKEFLIRSTKKNDKVWIIKPTNY